MHMVRCGVQTGPKKQKLCLCNLFAVCHKKKAAEHFDRRFISGADNGALPVIRHMQLCTHALTLNSSRASSSAISTVYTPPLITSAVQSNLI